MKTAFIAAALALTASAGIASAQGAGHDQLAAQIGVDPARYTLAELVTADSALRDDNAQNAAFVLSGAARTAVAAQPVPYIGQGRD